jgi:GntR family transcriptional regulator
MIRSQSAAAVLAASFPTPVEISRLGIQAGTPVAEHRRVGYTPDGKAVRVMISIIPGDTLVLRYVVAT